MSEGVPDGLQRTTAAVDRKQEQRLLAFKINLET